MRSTTIAAVLGAGILAILSLAAGPALLTGAAAACTAPPGQTNAGPATPDPTDSMADPRPTPPAGEHAATAGYDADQVANAAVIVGVGAQLGVSVRGWIIAVAVAMQESGLRNLDHGDSAGPDSRGLFQQRSAWGSLAERMDPAASTRLFFTGGHRGQPGLLAIPGWQALPLTVAAQAVQHSAFPSAYAHHEDDASALVSAIAGTTGTTLECAGIPDPTAGQAVAFARAQLDLPYQWAGDGPAHGDSGFDCSGLTRAAYAAGGITLPRTAQAQYDAGPRIPAGTPLLPGDLLFFGPPAHVHHVGIYVSDSRMIDAPHAGAVVRVENYRRWSDYLGATRPGRPATLPAAASSAP